MLRNFFYIVGSSLMNEYAATAKWHWRRKNKESGERHVQVSLHIVTTVRLHVITTVLWWGMKEIWKNSLMISFNWLWRLKHDCLWQFLSDHSTRVTTIEPHCIPCIENCVLTQILVLFKQYSNNMTLKLATILPNVMLDTLS